MILTLIRSTCSYQTGLDPDEGVVWNAEFQSMDKDKMPLRVMPNEIKEIKEACEIDCFLNLAGKSSNQTFVILRVTRGMAHLHGLAPGQHSSEVTSRRWRAVGDIVSAFTDPGFEP